MMKMYYMVIGMKIDVQVIMIIRKKEIICYQIQINGNMKQHTMI